MYLRRIELQGFKTFPRRTTLDLQPGVTAIVGPNGSGKSNLSDAVRWAMGEQAPRNLRIRRAQDVIFAGAESRARTGMAEVLLTFDNAAGWLPIEYDQVVIGRRLFRSGQTEYTLNGARVRLRDVTDLLSAGAAGHGGPAVMSQGQVDQVLRQRPEDRRAFLEEAAGIARFYARRDQAQRRLAETRRNLERLRDIAADIEPRLDTLRAQAQVAERGQALNRELRGGQRALAQHRLFTVTDQMAAAEAREQAAANALARLLAEPAEELRRRAAAAELRAAALDRDLADARRDLEARRRAAVERAARRALLEERRANLRARRGDLAERHARLLHQADTLAADVEVAQASFAQVQEYMSRVRVERQQMLDALEPEREREQRRAAQLAELADARDLRASLRERLRHAEAEGQALRAAHEQRTSDVQTARARAEAARGQSQEAAAQAAAAAAALDRAETAQREATARARAAQAAQAQAGETFRVAQEAAAALRRECAALRAAADQAGVGGQTLRDMRAAAPQAAIVGRLRGQMRAHDPQAERLLDAAFPAGRGTLLVERPQDGAALRAAATNLSASRLRWRPAQGFRGWPYEGSLDPPERDGILGTLADRVDAHGPQAEAMRRLLRSVLVAVDLPAALRARQELDAAAARRIVTLDGDAIDTDGGVQLAAADRGGADVGARIAAAANALAEKTRRLPGLHDAAADAQNALTDADEHLADADTRLADARRAARTATQAAAQAAHEHQRQDGDARALAARRQDAHARLLDYERAAAGLRPRIDQAEREAARLSAALEQAGGASTGLAAAEARLAVLDATLATTAGRAADLQAQAAQRRSAAAAARTDAEAAAQARAAQARALGEVDADLAALEPADDPDGGAALDESHVRALETEALDVRLEHQRLGMQIERRTWEERQAETALAAAQRETERLTERRAEIRAHARDDLGMTELRPARLEVPVARVERRTAELRRLLHTLGPVNPLAPAEYARERERVETTRRQIVDLEGAETNLHELARSLQSQLRDEFMAAFQAMNAAFGTVFAELFGGGGARMVLTSPGDLERTGMEFEIRVPGKRVQDLASLSGGERALVAAALTLALLHVRPAPFCILDEVDAALDDENVARFCRQVHALAARTQMLVITHNAVTVETAATIYGVTMREAGVSDLISIRLDDAAAAGGNSQAGARTNGRGANGTTNDQAPNGRAQAPPRTRARALAQPHG